MTRYLVLIYGDERRWDAMSADEAQQIDEGHRTFRTRAGAKIIASGELEPTAHSVTLRSRSERSTTVTDGPFLETKEVLGGFYLVEATDRDEVVTLASGLAEVAHDHSAVEIVPVVG
jgi:hypothetical protein